MSKRHLYIIPVIVVLYLFVIGCSNQDTQNIASSTDGSTVIQEVGPIPIWVKLDDSTNTMQQRLAAAVTSELLAASPNSALLEDRTTYLTPNIQKYVYLTFDDGPSQYTPKLLEILHKNNVPATFFVQYDADQDLYHQIVAAGHTLALHTYSHNYAQIYASETAFFADLNKISTYVKSITGIDSKIVRMAGGSSNTISRNYNKGVVTRIADQLNRQDYVYFDWNAQGMDATTPVVHQPIQN